MSSSPRSTLRRVVAAGAAAAALVVSLVASPAVGLAAPAPQPGEPVAPLAAALDWVTAEVLAHDGVLSVAFGDQSYQDAGMTLDAAITLAGAGEATGPAVDAIASGVVALMPDYLTGFAGGAARAAGAVAKTHFAELALGRDLSPGFALEADLRDLMELDGDHVGRFRDREGWEGADYSNGIGQAFAVLALARTAEGIPPAAVDYLLDQQCSDGSFRLYYDVGSTCADPAEGDADATAMALMALHVAPTDDEVAAASAEAVAYLLAQQDETGGLLGTGAVNTNTTGLAAAALRGAGEDAAADAAARFVRSMQWTATCEDLGAVAYDAAILAEDVAAGEITGRTQWARSTVQGALGLGLPAFGAIGAQTPAPVDLDPIACTAPTPPEEPAPVDPVPGAPADPTIELRSGASVPAGGLIEGTAHGFEPGETVTATLHSTPRELGTMVADAGGAVSFSLRVPTDIEPGVHTLVLTGQTSGRSASVSVEVTGIESPRILPVTGDGSAALAAAGSSLLLAGLVLAAAGARRRRAAEVVR